MKHLPQIMGEVERSTSVNRVLIFPILGGDAVFNANSITDITQSNRTQRVQRGLTKSSLSRSQST